MLRKVATDWLLALNRGKVSIVRRDTLGGSDVIRCQPVRRHLCLNLRQSL